MTNYKEILRLYCAGYPQRDIAVSVGCSKNTVGLCIQRAIGNNLTLPVPEEFTNERIHSSLFTSRKGVQDSSFLAPDCEMLSDELKRPHVTRKLLWTEYVESCQSLGLRHYSISQFNLILGVYLEKNNVSLRRNHNPGEVLELDWTGSAIDLTSTLDGSRTPCHLFVAAFPYSSYFYAEAFPNENIHSWTTGITHALSFFNGVPVILRPDNCRTATIKADKYEPELHVATTELAVYYKTAVVPARVRKPRDKNVVESTAGLVSRQVIAAVRNQVFFSLDEINKVVIEKGIVLNDAGFSKKEGSRSELFHQVEQKTLLPLPPKPFELFERTKAKAAPDYHVQFDKCYYSVHPKFIGDTLKVKASVHEVQIIDHNGEIHASHRRCRFPGQKSTLAEHVPEKHREVLGWSGDMFRSRAAKVGPNAENLIDTILLSREFEVQSYKPCLGILNLGRKVGSYTLEKACEEALRVGVKSYKGVKAIAEILAEKENESFETQDSSVSEDDPNLFFLTHSTSEGGLV